MRLKGRVDGNQKEIVEGLRGIGASVLVMSALGDGAPDILVGWRKKNILFEIKNPDQVPSARKLTPDEIKFRDTWEGNYYVITTVEQAVRLVLDHG